MIERRLQNSIALVLLFTHISVPLLVLGFFLAGGLSSSEFTTTLGIIVPMLAALSGLALTFVIRNKKRPKGRVKYDQITGIYAVTAVVFPVLLMVLIAGLVWMKAYNFGIASF